MNLKQSLSLAVVLAAMAPSVMVVAFSSSHVLTRSNVPLRPPRQASRSGISMALHYKNYHSSYYEIVDVDGDRMSLLSLLDPPAAPRTNNNNAHSEEDKLTPDARGRSRRSTQSTQRASPVTQLHSIQDYHKHVLDEPNRLCIIRFSAPWCKVCKSTNVAWERMASKIAKEGTNNNNANTKPIKFLSVNLDGRDESTSALKDMLQINRVPQGIIHHPTRGVFGQRVDLNRSNLSTLKKRLEAYVVVMWDDEDDNGGGSGMGIEMVLDGLFKGEGNNGDNGGSSLQLP